jgi:hypothetical protein
MFECVSLFLGINNISIRKNVSTPAIYIFEYLIVEILRIFITANLAKVHFFEDSKSIYVKIKVRKLLLAEQKKYFYTGQKYLRLLCADKGNVT